MTHQPITGADSITHRRVLTIAVPMTLAYLSTPLLGLVDTTVIGRLGDAALLGAIAIGAIIFDIVFTTFNFLRSGTTGVTAQALGRGDRKEIDATFYRALIIAGASGVALVLLQWPMLEAGLALMGASETVNAATRVYFEIRVLSAPFALANYVILGWFIGLGRAGTGLLLQTLLNGLNIILNVWFVLGLGWGVAGVAWGTVIAETLVALVGLVLVMRAGGRFMRRPHWARIMNAARFKVLLALNRDIMIRSFALIFAFAYFTRAGASQGDVILAANAILMNFFMVGGYFLDGFATAAEQLAGESLGARIRAAFRRAVRLTLIWGFALSGIASLLFWLAGPMLIDIMTTNPEVRDIARTYLVWAALTPLVGVAAFQFDGVYIGATWSSDMRNMMLASLVLFLAAVHLLMPPFGNHGLWMALMIFLGARGITLWLRYPYRLDRAFNGVAVGAPSSA